MATEGLVSEQIPGFYNGVSQQAAPLRLPTQVDQQENCLGTLVDGLLWRPNTEHKAVLNSLAQSGCFTHKIRRDASEKYNVVITDDTDEPIEVFKNDGTKCTVQYGTLDDDLNFTADADVKGYLVTSGDPADSLRAITVGDHTFITNKEVTTDHTGETQGDAVGMKVQQFSDLPASGSSAGFTEYPNHTFVGGAAHTLYSKSVGENIQLDFYMPNGMHGEPINGTPCTLWGYIEYKLSTESEWTRVSFTFVDQTSLPTWKTYNLTGLTTGTYDFRVALAGFGNTCIWYSWSTSSNAYEVVGTAETQYDNYYLEWDGDVYREISAPGILFRLASATMPHKLVRTDTNEFTFAPITWGERSVGDDSSNPMPSFIGQPIDNLFFFKNRLSFISKGDVAISEDGEYYNFWRTSVIDLLDSDPIFKVCSDKEVTDLKSSAVFNKSVILFGERVQFNLSSGEELFTPKTAQLIPTTRFACRGDSEPIPVGTNVYFPSPKDDYLNIMEYLILPDSTTEDAANVSSHVPNYVPNGRIMFEACNSLDILFIHSSAEPDTLRIYKYYWNGVEKAQSAWSKWTFNGDILGMNCIESELFLLIRKDGVVCLESMQLEDTPTGALDFRVHLDDLTTLTGTYDGQANETTWTLPDSFTGEWVGVDTVTGQSVGTVTNNLDGTVTASGDHTTNDVYFGQPYSKRCRLSEWYTKNSKGVAVTEGTLKVRKLTLSYKDTSYFEVHVTPQYRDTIEHVFNGSSLGSSVIGTIPIRTGEETFLCMSKTKGLTVEITSDSYLPAKIQSGSWEGFYTVRSTII